METNNKRVFAKNIRNLVFGAEDSLVSTVGLLSGITVAGVSGQDIVITGVILIFVEAFSMGIGSLLSEHGSEEYLSGQDIPIGKTVTAPFIMFVSYFVTGFIPLLPYIFLEPLQALWLSIVLALISLFILGLWSAKIYKIRVYKHGLQMLLIGGGAVLIGAVVGTFIKGV